MSAYRYWRKVLGLPPWTTLGYLGYRYLPMHRRGPSYPNLEIRLTLLLVVTYLCGSYSRNEYTIAATHYLMTKTRPSFEGASLLRRVLPWGLSVAILPSSTHPDVPVQVEGDMDTLLQTDTPITVTNAAIFDYAHSCAVVLYSPATQQQVGCSMSYAALDQEPVVLETMARLLLLHVLREWIAQLWPALDCVSALWRMYTKLPHKDTAMASIFHHLSFVFQGVRMRELWVEAKHDSQSQDFLSHLNAQAHTRYPFPFTCMAGWPWCTVERLYCPLPRWLQSYIT